MNTTQEIDVRDIRAKSLMLKHQKKVLSLVPAAEAGVLPPIHVRRNGDVFTIIDGRHRFAAHVIAGIQTITCIVRQS